MTSFSVKSDPRRGVFVKLVRDVQHTLNLALQEEHAKRGLTQADIVTKLDKNKSAISRAFQETGNLTLETIADLAFALDRTPELVLVEAKSVDRTNYSLRDVGGVESEPEVNRLTTQIENFDSNFQGKKSRYQVYNRFKMQSGDRDRLKNSLISENPFAIINSASNPTRKSVDDDIS